MPEPADPCPATLPPEASELADIAAELVGASCPDCPPTPFLLALPAGRGSEPCLGPDADGADVEVLPIAGVDPVELLCHQRPSPGWAAAGVMVDGWTVPPSAEPEVDWRTLRPTVPISRHPARRAVRTLHLVSRGGAVALALLGHGDDRPEVHVTDDGAEAGGPCGPLPDALRRLFGLATPPCPVGAVELWASIWLQVVVASGGSRSSWAAVARAHPAAALLGGEGIRATPENLVVAGRALARGKGWGELQLDAVTGGEDAWPFMPPSAVAAWADSGMFARLVLRHLSPLWLSRRELAPVLAAGVLSLVDDVLAAWGLNAEPPAPR